MRRLLLILALCGCVGDDPAPVSNGAGDAGTTADGGGTAKPELTLGSSARPVAQGGKADLQVSVLRNAVASAFVVHVSGLPTGVSASDLPLVPTESAGTITLTAAGSVPIGTTANAVVELFDGAAKVSEKPLVVTVTGKPGTLDVTWGTGGLAQTNTTALGGDAATTLPTTAVAVYPATSPHAGKIAIAGKLVQGGEQKLFVARLDASGKLEKSVIVAPGAVEAGNTEAVRAVRIVIDSQDRIVLASNRVANDGFCLAEVRRFGANVEVDTTYKTFSGILGDNGCGNAEDLAVLPDDSPLLLGTWNRETANGWRRWAILQTFSATGAKGGRQTVAVDSHTSTQAFRMAVDAQRRVILAGSLCTGSAYPDQLVCKTLLARVTVSGLDPTFGTGGSTIFDFGGTSTTPGDWQSFYGLALNSDGSAVGVGTNAAKKFAALARTNPDGTATATFGSAAQIKRQFVAGSTIEAVFEALFDADGRIVTVGYAFDGSTLSFVHTRMDRNGALDGSYGEDGIGKVGPGRSFTYGPRAAVTLDGRLLIVGNSTNSSTAVWRLWL